MTIDQEFLDGLINSEFETTVTPEGTFPIAMSSLKKGVDIFLEFSDKDNNIVPPGEAIVGILRQLAVFGKEVPELEGEAENQESEQEALARLMLLANCVIVGVIGRTFGMSTLQGMMENQVMYSVMSEIVMAAFLVAQNIFDKELMPIYREELMSEKELKKAKKEHEAFLSYLEQITKELNDVD